MTRSTAIDELQTPPLASDISLGILAGGRATRLGGVDKAWLERDGLPQVVRLTRGFDGRVATVLVSANRDPWRYRRHGLQPIADRITDVGPIAGLEALAGACRTTWLLTLAVDIVGVNECLLPSLVAAAGERGASSVDDEGEQPLVALWHARTMCEAANEAIARGALSVQALQVALGMAQVRFPGVRFGNLNTPSDLSAAGMRL